MLRLNKSKCFSIWKQNTYAQINKTLPRSCNSYFGYSKRLYSDDSALKTTDGLQEAQNETSPVSTDLIDHESVEMTNEISKRFQENNNKSIYDDQYFQSIKNALDSKSSEMNKNSDGNNSTSSFSNKLLDDHVSMLKMELKNKDEEKEDLKQWQQAMSILEFNVTGESKTPVIEVEDLNVATRGAKLKPAKEDYVVINPLKRFGSKKNSNRSNFGYQAQKTEEFMKLDAYAFLRDNSNNITTNSNENFLDKFVVDKEESKNNRKKGKNSKSTDKAADLINNPIERTKLNIMLENITNLASGAPLKSNTLSPTSESLLDSINALKPFNTTISPEIYAQIVKDLNSRFTKSQLYKYAKLQESTQIPLSSKAVKPKIIEYIIGNIWDCSISYSKILEHEEILHLDKVQSYLLFFGDDNHEVFRYLYERGIKISLELPRGNTTEEETLKTSIRVKGTKEQCKLAEVYIRTRLKKFKVYEFDLEYIVNNHFGNMDTLCGKNLPLKTIVEHIQSEVGCFIEPTNNNDYRKCYLHTIRGKDKFSKARRFLLSILKYSPQTKEIVIDLTPKEDIANVKKYPNPNIESLLWNEKDKVFFRERVAIQRFTNDPSKDSSTTNSSTTEDNTWEIKENQVDEIYEKLHHLETSEHNILPIKSDKKFSNVSIQLGSYMEAEDKTTSFVTKINDLNEKVLNLPTLEESEMDNFEENTEENSSLENISNAEDFEALRLENEKQGVLLEADDELTAIADSPLSTMVVLKFVPKKANPDGTVTKSEVSEQIGEPKNLPPAMELWFEKQSDSVKPDIQSARCLLPLKETQVILKTPQLKFDSKIVKDTYVELCKPFYEEEEEAISAELESNIEHGNHHQEVNDRWLKEQQGLKNYLNILDKMNIFNNENLPRLLTLNIPLQNGETLNDLQYEIVSMKEVTLLNYKYENKYITQFSDIRIPELNCYTNQVDFIGGEELNRQEFGEFLKSVLRF